MHLKGIKIIYFKLVVLIALISFSHLSLAEVHPAYKLYYEGKPKLAHQMLVKIVKQVESKKSTAKEKWQAYMAMAWLENELGDSSSSLNYSAKALVQTKNISQPYFKGRTLSWLGWSYSNMGQYEIAIKFFNHAIKIGAPKGKISIVGVWGLATQELGRVYMKMGNLNKARTLIEETTNFARKNNILVGIAEGGSHLANIALLKGRNKKALKLAKEALAASIKCNCSPNNTARAKVTLAKVLLELAKKNPSQLSPASIAIQDAIEHGNKTLNRRHLANAYILKSRLLALGGAGHGERLDLMNKAEELMKLSKSDNIAVAKGELGNIYLDDYQPARAKLYFQAGLKISKKMFKKIDKAYLLADYAKLHLVEDEIKKYSLALIKSLKLAKNSRSHQLVYENSIKLFNFYLKEGYLKKALQFAETAVKSVGFVLKGTKDQKEKDRLSDIALDLREHIVEITMELRNENTF